MDSSYDAINSQNGSKTLYSNLKKQNEAISNHRLASKSTSLHFKNSYQSSPLKPDVVLQSLNASGGGNQTMFYRHH